MISIVIASIKKEYLDQISANIAETVGIPFEIISFDNSNGVKGLCEVYNLGTQQAKFDLICFMHEDVAISTVNWGKFVANAFDQDEQLGLIGLAGSSYKSVAPSGWFCNGGPQKINYINLLQRYKFDEVKTFHNCQNPRNESLSTVVSVDGVWFCTRKSVALKYPFDQHTFKKFHCYDIDFSLSIYPEFKSAVTFDILLEHFSEGNYDRTWIEETIKLYKKWQPILPINLEGLTNAEINISEKHAFRFFLQQMRLAGFGKAERLKVLMNSKIHKKIGFALFAKLCMEA